MAKWVEFYFLADLPLSCRYQFEFMEIMETELEQSIWLILFLCFIVVLKTVLFESIFNKKLLKFIWNNWDSILKGMYL